MRVPLAALAGLASLSLLPVAQAAPLAALLPLVPGIISADTPQSIGRLTKPAPGGGLAGYAPLVTQTTGVGGVKRLYTSSLAYCSQPGNLLVQNVDILYYPGNATLYFAIDMTPVSNNLTVSANINVNAYSGFRTFDLNIDFCENLLYGLLCPLPTLPFIGEQWSYRVGRYSG